MTETEHTRNSFEYLSLDSFQNLFRCFCRDFFRYSLLNFSLEYLLEFVRKSGFLPKMFLKFLPIFLTQFLPAIPIKSQEEFWSQHYFSTRKARSYCNKNSSKNPGKAPGEIPRSIVEAILQRIQREIPR